MVIKIVRNLSKYFATHKIMLLTKVSTKSAQNEQRNNDLPTQCQQALAIKVTGQKLKRPYHSPQKRRTMKVNNFDEPLTNCVFGVRDTSRS